MTHVLARPARSPDMTLRYGAHPDQVVDLRLPPSAEPRALVVVIHGGFWRTGYDRAHAGPQSAALADAGYVVATIEYRRVGRSGGGWPSTFDDVALVLDELPDLLATAAGHPPRIGSAVLVGHSAGAHLALWSAGRHRLPPGSAWHRRTSLPLAGVVCLAGVTNLARAEALRLGSDAVRALLGGEAREHPERLSLADPASLLPLGTPTVLLHGTADDVVPVALTRDYARRAAMAGDPVTSLEIPDADHYSLIDPLSPAWGRVLAAIEGLL